jgi:tRNA pseudouridine55 synthase
VLPIFFGRATVLAEHLSAQGKRYTGEVVLGWASATDDAEGELTAAPLPSGVDEAAVASALAGFAGHRAQAPPAYSAVKIEGQRSYKMARRGDEPAPAPRLVHLEQAHLTGFQRAGDGLVATVDVTCGPGFYVRALARDLGRALGTAGYLRGLRRTRVGSLDAADSITLDEAEELGPALGARLAPATLAVASLLEVVVLPVDEGRLAHGMEIAAPVVGSGAAFARAEDGRLLAIGEVSGGRFRPRRLVEAG